MIDNEARDLAARNLDIVARCKASPGNRESAVGVVVFYDDWTPSLRALLDLQTGFRSQAIKIFYGGHEAYWVFLEVNYEKHI